MGCRGSTRGHRGAGARQGDTSGGDMSWGGGQIRGGHGGVTHGGRMGGTSGTAGAVRGDARGDAWQRGGARGEPCPGHRGGPDLPPPPSTGLAAPTGTQPRPRPHSLGLLRVYGALLLPWVQHECECVRGWVCSVRVQCVCECVCVQCMCVCMHECVRA